MNNKLLVVKEVENAPNQKEGVTNQAELADIYALLEEWLTDAQDGKTDR
ncbi:MAG: hypothetical protein WCT39_05365 [Candidatus Margulisiibacteriota bacterium]